MSANLKNKMSVIVTKVAITAPTPALIPDRLTTKKNTSSTVVGIDNSDTVTFAGSANFRTPDMELIEKSINKIIDTALACFFILGNFERIPFPNMEPCRKPIPKTMIKVIA